MQLSDGDNNLTVTGGARQIRTTQLGFAAELTSAWSATTGYSWKRLALVGVALTNPSLQVTGNKAVALDGSESLTAGTQVWLEPDDARTGWVFVAPGTGSDLYPRCEGGQQRLYRLLPDGTYTYVRDLGAACDPATEDPPGGSGSAYPPGATDPLVLEAVTRVCIGPFTAGTLVGRAAGGGDGGMQEITPDEDFFSIDSDGLLTVADGAAAAIGIDTSSFTVLTPAASDVQAAFEETDAALLKARGTGIQYGGDLSDLGSGVVRIAAGSGGILDNTTPASPTYTAVTWAQQDIDLSGVGSGLRYLYIDDTGTLQATATAPSHEDYRLYIWLWRVSMLSGAYSASTAITQPVQQYGPQVWDIWRALGSIKRDLILSANGANLSLNISAGEAYQAGANFFTNPLSPHEVEFTAKTAATIRLVTSNGTSTADRTTLDPGNYDSGGTVTAIPGSSLRAQIWTVKMFLGSGGRVRIFYGQSYYTSVNDAYTALSQGTYTPTIPAAYNDAITLGWVITQKGATALNDGVQIFVSANKFGLAGGSVATVGAVSLIAANNLSDLASASTARTNLGLGTLATQSSLRGYIDGVITTRASTTTVTVAAGTVCDSTDAYMLQLSASTTKTLQSSGSWTAGTGNNGLDTGALANSTWYHVWVISTAAGATVDVLFSTSATAPTMPATYTLKRRIGSIKTDGSGNIIDWVQDGDEFQWKVPVADISATNPGTSAVTRTLTVPTGVRVKSLLAVAVTAATNTDNADGVFLSDLSITDTTAASTVFNPIYGYNGGAVNHQYGGYGEVWTNTSAQIRSRLQVSAAGTVLIINTLGWRDPRGKNS